MAACRGVRGRRVRLPFDLSEVVTNLRQERYRQRPNTYLERITAASGVAKPLLLSPAAPAGRRAEASPEDSPERLGAHRVSRGGPSTSPSRRSCERVMALLLKQGGPRRVPFIWFWPDGATQLRHHDARRRGPGRHGVLRRADGPGRLVRHQVGVPAGAGRAPGHVERSGREAPAARVRGQPPRPESRRVPVPEPEAVPAAGGADQSSTHASSSAAASVPAPCIGSSTGTTRFEFSYDMSVPNAAHLEPQRGGCCTVMPYFVGDILELPLTTTQDYSLFHILGEYSTALWKEQIELLAVEERPDQLHHPSRLSERAARRSRSTPSCWNTWRTCAPIAACGWPCRATWIGGGAAAAR